jgi:hypothetical protein
MLIKLADSVPFFEKRISSHAMPNNLKGWVNSINDSDKPIEKYIEIMNYIKLKAGLKVDWSNLPESPEKIKELWALRECIVALSFITADIIASSKNQQIKIGKAPIRTLLDDRAEFIILGSTTLLSDIDVTIVSHHSSLHISIIEDLWEATGWFDHSSWKVDLYGDFTMIGEYYMDTHFLNKAQLTELLILATASYFRHEKSAYFDNSILDKLIEVCINSEKLTYTKTEIIKAAKEVAASLKVSSREVYYKTLGKAELMKEKILSYFSKKDDSVELKTLLGDCMIAEGHANLHREENYILVSTVIHVVKVEQGKNNRLNGCKQLFVTLARCSLDTYVYVLSAIEQLGYMQENLNVEKNKCNMAAGKYFGRFLRALRESKKVASNKLEPLLSIADILAIEKKTRGNAGDKNSSCGYELIKLAKAIEFS